LILLFLLFLFGAVKSTTCNSFPKIFGSAYGESALYHIDVYNDYLALAGGFYDYYIFYNYNYWPYLALSSISTGGKYYYAKVLT
jgi:hypothetical protein